MKLFFLFFLFLVGFVAAEEAAAPAQASAAAPETPKPLPPHQPQHILTDMPKAHPQVQVSCYLPPLNTEKEFRPGDIVDALVGVSNEGTDPIVFHMMAGALLTSADPPQFYQNFTEFPYNITIHPTHAATVHYKFRPDPRVEARTFNMIIVAFYHDAVGTNYSSTAYNATFELSDFPDKMDAITFFMYLGGLALLILLAVVFYKPLRKMMRSKMNPAARPKKEHTKEEEEDQLKALLAGTPAGELLKREEEQKKKAQSPSPRPSRRTPSTSS